jgi:hypothetical protein
MDDPVATFDDCHHCVKVTELAFDHFLSDAGWCHLDVICEPHYFREGSEPLAQLPAEVASGTGY